MFTIEERLLQDLECSNKRQRDIAVLYAACIIAVRHRPTADRATGLTVVSFRRINAAITKRWKGKSALTRIKTMAWKLLEQ